MSGVFLSYSRTDKPLAEKVVRGLRAIGVEVWWDQDMPGVDWQRELERQATELTALIVLWTPASANSEYVRDEARLALSRHKLVNALSGLTAPPFPFDRINGLPLDDWNGHDSHGGWSRLVATLEEHLVRAGAARPGQLTAALARRDAALQDAQRQVDAADDAYAEAKAREGETTEAAKEARTAFEAAETQLQRVAEMRVSTVVLRAAQEELDLRRAALDSADSERRAAAATLSAASRAVTRAKNELARVVGEQAPLLAPPGAEPEQVAEEKTAPQPEPEESAAKETDLAAASGATDAGQEPGKPEVETPKLDMGEVDTLKAETTEPDATTKTDQIGGGQSEGGQGGGQAGGGGAQKKRGPSPLLIGGLALAGLVSFFVLASLLAPHTPATIDYNLPNIPAVKTTDTQLDIDTIKSNGKGAATPQEADYWWAIGAEKGDAEAQFQLGYAYCFGKGVTTDDQQALIWFQKAADQNNTDAEEWVGSYYEHGYGVTADLTKARFWYVKAAAAGNSYAQNWLNTHPENGDASSSDSSSSSGSSSSSDSSSSSSSSSSSDSSGAASNSTVFPGN